MDHICSSDICDICENVKTKKPLGRTLEELIAEARRQPGAIEILKEWAENTLAHHGNPLYHKAAEYTAKIRAGQINKGAAKYPQPLRSESWTFHQLVDHAMEENVDQAHYLTALREKADGIAQRLELAKVAEQAMLEIKEAVKSKEIFEANKAVESITAGYFMVKEMIGRGGGKSEK